MGLSDTKLKRASPIYGVNQPIQVKGSITLSVKICDDEQTIIQMMDFLVVNHPITYNVNFHRQLMKKINMVMVTHSFKVKFSTPTSDGNMKSN